MQACWFLHIDHSRQPQAAVPSARSPWTPSAPELAHHRHHSCPPQDGFGRNCDTSHEQDRTSTELLVILACNVEFSAYWAIWIVDIARGISEVKLIGRLRNERLHKLRVYSLILVLVLF